MSDLFLLSFTQPRFLLTLTVFLIFADYVARSTDPEAAPLAATEVRPGENV